MNKKLLFSTELTEKNRYLQNYLIDKFSRHVYLPASNFLEIGIGNGRFGVLLGSNVAHYFGIDIDREYVRIARKNIPKRANITYKTGNAENIPFDRKFDIMFYSLSWHFIEDKEKALEEAKRVLRPEGIIAVLEPSENVDTKDWASPKLRRNSPEFNLELWNKKLKAIINGRQAILEQRLFKIIEDEYDTKTAANLYILSQTS